MRKCRVCKVPYEPRNSLQKACSIMCAMALAKIDRERAERKAAQEDRKAQREAKQRIKTRSQWMREAQAAFNAYIRARDADLPCICCGRSPNDADLLTGSRWDAGHYRSVGSCPELRFEPMNCHKTCVRCNRDLSGNIVEMRIGMRAKVGIEALDWLEGPHEPKKYTIDELQAIKRQYAAMTRELTKQREAA